MNDRSDPGSRSSAKRVHHATRTKSAILEAAERRLLSEGFHATRLSDLTADVGVTTGAFYRQFASKDALYATMFARMIERLETALLEASDLIGAIEAWLRVSADHPGTLRAQFEVIAFRTPMADKWALARDRWEAALLRLLPSRSAQDRLIASLVVDTLEYYAYAGTVGWWPPRDPAMVAQTLATIVEHGLYPPWPPGQTAPPAEYTASGYRTTLEWVPSGGKVMPTSARGARTFQSLQRAAVEIFADLGVRQATMLDIAQTAGVASGTAYRYFDDKVDVLRSLMAQFEQDLVQSAFYGMRDGRHAVAETYRSFLTLHRQQVGVFRAWWALMEPGSYFESAWIGMHSTLMGQFVKVLRHGVSEGLISKGLDLELTAQLYSGMHERSAFARVALGRDLGSDDSEVAEVLDRVFNGGLIT
jgi:AcrR family transcriptional regulator